LSNIFEFLGEVMEKKLRLGKITI